VLPSGLHFAKFEQAILYLTKEMKMATHPSTQSRKSKTAAGRNSKEARNEAARAAQSAELHSAEQSRHSVTIRKTPDEVFAFWRDFSNMPRFMKDITEVTVLSPTRSHWVVTLKHGPSVEWDAEIISERPGQMISWQSVGDSEVKQAGSVWFIKAPGDLGTIVRLSMNYTVPGGKLVEAATKLLGEDPDTLIIVNLRRLKAFLETGEIPTTEGQPSGRDDDARPAVTH
jgi:uncharacterized membrane protein